MNKGCLLFAHNGTLDYGSQAVLAARLAKKHLGVPICIVTDIDTMNAMTDRFKGDLPFDQMVIVEKPEVTNFRKMNGIDGVVEFNNSNRSSAWDLTPYDRTLIIDTDFLIFSDKLNDYWDSPYDFLITPGMSELQEEFVKPTEHKVSETSVNLLWATNIMFTKNEDTKLIFDLVSFIKQEYNYFSYLYEFLTEQYRNDFAFSIACHILSGHGMDPIHGTLPVPLFFIDTDEIIDIKKDGQINFLLKTRLGKPLLAKCSGQDVHIMNKKSLIENIDKFMELT
jgi:hypothetical protein